MHTHTYTLTHTHIYIYIYTHTHTHTHLHTCDVSHSSSQQTYSEKSSGRLLTRRASGVERMKPLSLTGMNRKVGAG